MSMPYQPPGPPGAPQWPPPPLPAGPKISAMAVTIGVALLAVGLMCVVALAASPEPTAPPTTPPAGVAMVPMGTTIGPDQSRERLTGVVAYKSRFGFQVCTRSPLHNCTVDFATTAAVDRRVIRMGPVDINPVATCEHITDNASAACEDAGASLLAAGGPSPSWLRCMALHGLVCRHGSTVMDPRDEPPNMPAGTLNVRCNEGYLHGSFDDTL